MNKELEITRKLRESGANYEINVLVNEYDRNLSEQSDDDDLYFRAIVKVVIFEKSSDPGLKPQERSTVVRYQQANAIGHSYEEAENNAISRALSFLGY